ncbi:MAG: lysylphosphatidylglycerol synthase transmembrane domain-containing protein [Polyangiaceae bacterium]
MATTEPIIQNRERGRLRASLLRIVGLILGLALFVYTLRGLDTASLGRILHDLGPLVLLVLVPQGLGTLVHTLAWRSLLAPLGTRAPLFALTGTFLASESARMALPAGAAIGESLATWGVKSRFGVSWRGAVATVATKKAWVFGTHGLCILGLLLVAHEPLDRLARNLPAGFAIYPVTIGMALSLLFSNAFALALLTSRRAARVAVAIVARIPWQRTRLWAAERARSEGTEAAFAIPTLAHAKAALFLLLQWMTEICESWLILRLLGLPVTFSEALVLELGGSLVRAAAFLIPGGLGVQDASFVGMIAALGFPGAEAAGAAFVLLKRAKEAFYILLGLITFSAMRREPETIPPLAVEERS